MYGRPYSLGGPSREPSVAVTVWSYGFPRLKSKPALLGRIHHVWHASVGDSQEGPASARPRPGKTAREPQISFSRPCLDRNLTDSPLTSSR
jgi:hypothetical protein